MVIVETRAFTARIRELLSDDEYRLLQNDLVARPDLGMLLAYPKSERDDLTTDQRAALRKVVESEYP